MAEKSKPAKRKIPPAEERAKRGRWLIAVIFVGTIFFSYLFSLHK